MEWRFISNQNENIIIMLKHVNLILSLSLYKFSVLQMSDLNIKLEMCP